MLHPLLVSANNDVGAAPLVNVTGAKPVSIYFHPLSSGGGGGGGGWRGGL